MNHRVLLRAWILVCAIAGLSLFVSQLWEIPVRSALRGYDNTFNYLWLRSAAVDGDWDFRNDIEQADTLVPDHKVSALGLAPTAAGRLPNKYGVGWALLTAPFYLVADAVVGIGRSLGWWQFARDGFNPVYQLAIQIGQMGLALCGLWLAQRVVTLWTESAEAALFGVSTVWAASPLLYYQSVNLSMSHSAAFVTVAFFAYALTRAMRSESMGWWILAGAAFGLAVITRFQLAVFGGVAAAALFSRRESPPADESRNNRPDVTGPLRRVIFFAAGLAPLIALQLWAWRAVYGEWLVFSYGAEGESFHWSRPEFLNSLFSSWHGLFYWHPYLLLAVIGMAAWAATARGLALVWGLTFALTAYVSASWWCWWFASAFGNRSYDAALLPLMAGAAWLLHRATPRWRTTLLAVAILAGFWNFYVATLYRTGAISRSQPVTWAEMVKAAERLPEAARF